jgi:hypothetical protein
METRETFTVKNAGGKLPYVYTIIRHEMPEYVKDKLFGTLSEFLGLRPKETENNKEIMEESKCTN